MDGMIPTKNPSALIAYYVGIFSIIPCFGPIPAIVALILGIKGLNFVKQHPEAKGKAHAWVGIIVGGLFGFGYLVIAVAVVLVGATDLID